MATFPANMKILSPPEGLCKWKVFQRGPGSFHVSLRVSCFRPCFVVSVFVFLTVEADFS